jgi:hypothetical protein
MALKATSNRLANTSSKRFVRGSDAIDGGRRRKTR